MNINEFDELYKNKGGFKSLDYFKENFYTLKYIAKHFGVTRPAVRLWFKDLFGIDYDPRRARREYIIEKMLDFAAKHSLEEFREAYYFTSKYYYNMALAEAYARNIYKLDDDKTLDQ